MTAKKHHYDGDLRAALIAAGVEVLREEGVDGLSLRKIAMRAGVSHAAPAHHFNGKTALLVAIATEGFQVFIDHMRKGLAKAAPEPQAQLLGLCHGYLDFAETHEALFELIFSSGIKAHADEGLRRVSMQSFQMLEETCALFEPSPDHAQAIEIMIWSLVHGYASLRVYSKMLASEEGEVMPFEFILPKLTPKT